MDKKYKKINLIVIFAIFAVATIMFFERTWLRVPVSDDLLYGFVLDDKPLGGNQYTQPIKTLSDAIYSQSQQYFGSNGRSIVHVFVQMFAGPWGQFTFSIVNTLMFIAAIFFFGRFAFWRKDADNVLAWVLTVILFLYLYPDRSLIWYSFAGGFNYLYPLLLSLLFLLTFNHLHKGSSKFIAIAGLVLAFVTGWSMECYAIPLSSGMFIWLLISFKSLKLSRGQIAMIAMLWIGTAILVFAPGNYKRMSGSVGPLMMAFKGAKYLAGTIPFWAAVISVAWMRYKSKEEFANFVNENKLLLCCTLMSILLGFVANTLPQSFCGVAFFSALVFFRSIDWRVSDRKKCLTLIVSCALLAGIIVHQFRIVQVSKELHNIHSNFIKQYQEATVPVFEIPRYYKPVDCQWFVYSWFEGVVPDWTMFTLECRYGSPDKKITLLSSEDYKMYVNSRDGIGALTTISGNAKLRMSKQYAYIDTTNVAIGDTIVMKFDNRVSPLKKLALRLIKFKAPGEQQVVINDSMMHTADSSFVMIPQERFPMSAALLKRK